MEINFNEVIDWLNRAEAVLQNGDFQPELKMIEPVIRQRFAQNFAQKSDADGNAWPPRKDNKPWPLENKTGLMSDSLIKGTGGGFVDRGPTHMSIGIDGGEVPYAVLQDQGSVTKNHPPRPYANINDKTADDCAEMMADLLAQKIFGV